MAGFVFSCDRATAKLRADSWGILFVAYPDVRFALNCISRSNSQLVTGLRGFLQRK